MVYNAEGMGTSVRGYNKVGDAPLIKGMLFYFLFIQWVLQNIFYQN